MERAVIAPTTPIVSMSVATIISIRVNPREARLIVNSAPLPGSCAPLQPRDGVVRSSAFPDPPGGPYRLPPCRRYGSETPTETTLRCRCHWGPPWERPDNAGLTAPFGTEWRWQFAWGPYWCRSSTVRVD